jgi:aarF domain-containing kinase
MDFMWKDNQNDTKRSFFHAMVPVRFTTKWKMFKGAHLDSSLTQNVLSIMTENPYSLPRNYNRQKLHDYWSNRPISVAKRLALVTVELGPRLGAYVWDFQLRRPDIHSEALQQRHAENIRQTLTHLGPAWIKGGQQLSIRPDLVSPVVLKELQKLCDAVQPIPDEVALQVLREELHISNLEDQFQDLKLVASASLGQVYQAKLRTTNELVAIKVQRPGMLQSFSLDLYLLQKLGNVLDRLFTTITKQSAYHEDLFDTFSRGSYTELDYEKEASNQIMFKNEFTKRKCRVKVPSVYLEFTSQRVLTTEWIHGVKLAEAPKHVIQKLIPDGVELFLTQLLDIGTFHADPHPGNLYVTNGMLCLLDFGLCAEVDEMSRRAMTKAIVHLLSGDFDSLVAVDAKELGFLPYDFDTEELKPLLTKILTTGLLESGSNLHHRKRKLMDISDELNDLFFRYPFSVPPFFALVTRGLGLLEGIALTGDPEFDIFQASLPYASRRAAQIMGAHGLQKALRRNLTIQRATARDAI